MDVNYSFKVFAYLMFTNALVLLCNGQFGNLGMLSLTGGGLGNGGLGMGSGGLGMGSGGLGMGSGGLAMGIGFGLMGMSPQDYAVLDNAVKTIISPQASPDMALIAFAQRQGGPPRNMIQMLGYMPFFRNIAQNVGLQPTAGQTSITGQNLDSIIMERAVQWMMSSGLVAPPMF